MPTQLDDRQVVNRAALAAIGTSANASLDTVFTAINTLFANATSAPTASVIMKRDANSNTQVNNLIPNFTSTATAAGTTTLVVGSSYYQQFTGSTTQTVVLPNATTLIAGQTFAILNRSTGYVTVNKNGGTLQSTLAPGAQALITVTNIGSAAGTWDTSTSTTGPIPFLQTSVITDSTTTGANATLTAADILNGVVRLTNASLTSVGGIPAGGSGQFLIVENKTGASVTINDEDTVATGANRILTGVSGPVTMLNDSTFAFTYDTTSSRWMLTGGSGSGTGSSGDINYITNPNALTQTQPWTAYADAAGSIPVDGQGGSPTISFLRSTASPGLRGSTHFRLIKPASNVQGQGASCDFSVDRADSLAAGTGPKQLQITLDYEIISGTYGYGTSSTLSDLSVWIYDRVNSVLIPCSGYKFDGGPLQCTFQTSSISDSYRLIFHIGTTTATAWTMQITNVRVGPQVTTSGPAMSDWVAYTPTFVGMGTVTSIAVKSRRVGDSLEVAGTFVVGTTIGTIASMTLGYAGANASVVVDTSKNNAGTAGTFNSNTPASTTYFGGGTVLAPNTNVSTVNFGVRISTVADYSASAGNVLWSTGSAVTVNFTVPIVGWSSNTLISDSASNRVVAVELSGTATVVGVGTLVAPTTIVRDTHGAWSGSTYRIPVPGWYRISGLYQAGSNTAGFAELYYQINGSGTVLLGGGRGAAVANLYASGSHDTYLKTGDTVGFIAAQNGTAQAPSAFVASISIIQGPSQIAASEVIAAKYQRAAAQAMTAGVPINWDVKEIDTHSAVTTGVGTWNFRCPAPGIYRITCMAVESVLGGSIYVSKNNSAVGPGLYLFTPAATGFSLSGGTLLQCNTGDTLDIRLDNSGTIAATNSYVCIERIGGVM